MFVKSVDAFEFV